MAPDNETVIETFQCELTLHMMRITRIVGELLSEIKFLTETVEAGKEVITPTHETETRKVIEASLALRKARENTFSQNNSAFQPFNHDPPKPTTLIFRKGITDKTQTSLPMNRSSHTITIKHHPI